MRLKTEEELRREFSSWVKENRVRFAPRMGAMEDAYQAWKREDAKPYHNPAAPDYTVMDDTADWAQQHYAETHGRRMGDERKE